MEIVSFYLWSAMFYYYGRRKQIAHLYPEPKYTTIIELFAGSAAYALYWAEKREFDVFLYDKSDTVALIWNYLLSASIADIKNLPSFNVGDNLNNFNSLSEAEKALIGFHINPGSSVPKLTVSKASRWESGRKYIMRMLPLTKHWKFVHDDYQNTPNVVATWFIDPPFQSSGIYYQHQIADYKKLSEWSCSRDGQIIICEADPANWLSFKPLGSIVNNGGLNKAKRRIDLVWTNQ